MRNGFAIVDTSAGVREAYRIVSYHRTQEAAESIIEREIRTTNKRLGGKWNERYGSFRRVFRVVDGQIAEECSSVGRVD